MPNSKGHPTPAERDEKISIPLDPATALEGLLQVDPTEIEPGQRWVSDPDEIVILKPVANMDDTWAVRTAIGETATMTTNEIIAGYKLA